MVYGMHKYMSYNCNRRLGFPFFIRFMQSFKNIFYCSPRCSRVKDQEFQLDFYYIAT